MADGRDGEADGDAGSPVSRELGFCPCCGYRTLTPSQPGSYEVCEICGWLDDLFGFDHPDAEGDYNYVSLSAARENVAEYGACLPGVTESTREPDGDERDPNHPYE